MTREPPSRDGLANEPAAGAASEAAGLASAIIARAHALGFALAGVCDARPSDHAEHLRAWLAAGKHSTMDWLATQADLRLDPASMLPGVRSIVAVGDMYAVRDAAASTREAIPPDHARVARYARGKDYHRVIKKRLHALCDALREEHAPHEFRACVDIEPTLEREHAARAGVGWVGRHTLLIHPAHGSYFLLGLILTTLPLEPPPGQEPVPDHCGTCTRCIDACPTGAIAPRGQPRSVDAGRCVSYLTLERRAAIPTSLYADVGDMIAGCDICQEVCPHNSPRPGAPATAIRDEYTPRFASLPLLEVLGWTQQERAARLSGMALKRATMTMWKRNAIVAAANALQSGSLDGATASALRARIAALASDESEDPLVQETARDALAALTGRAGRAPSS